MLNDLVIAAVSAITLVIFVCWAAVLLFLYAAWQLLHDRRSRNGIAALIGTVAIGVAVIFRTTGVGGPPSIAIDNARMIVDGAPYYLAPAFAALLGILALAWSRRLGLAAVVAFAALPLVLILLTRAPGGAGRSQPSMRGIAQDPPNRALVDPRFPDMVYVPSGPFIRGSLNPHQVDTPVGVPDGDEHPVRSIYLDGFFIDRLEVSNAKFLQFVETTGYLTDAERLGSGLVRDPAGFRYVDGANWRNPFGEPDASEPPDNDPVVQVSWNDAEAYCASVGKSLPTEAQWEKAARGTDGRMYPWGSAFDPARANYCDAECTARAENPATATDGFSRAAPVDWGEAGASPFGALNMAGNVWEWTADWYDPKYYAYAPDANPLGAVRAQSYQVRKVVRGGSWASMPEELYTTNRSYDDPTGWRSFGVGIRCALPLSAPDLEVATPAGEVE